MMVPIVVIGALRLCQAILSLLGERKESGLASEVVVSWRLKGVDVVGVLL
jgi:hypothetical protein